jgi:hypothetical protein
MSPDSKPKKKPEIISIRTKPADLKAESVLPQEKPADSAPPLAAEQPLAAPEASKADKSQRASAAPNNSKRRQQAIERIQQAVAYLVESNNLPDTVTARGHAIIAAAKQLTGSGISQTTLHKPEYLPLWHPDHYKPIDAVSKPAASNRADCAPQTAASTSTDSAPTQQPASSTSSPAAPTSLEAADQQQPASSDKSKPLTKDDIARRISLRLWRYSDHPEFALGLTLPELAKRWRFTSYKIGQRRTSPRFGKWSQKLDPEGLIWEYRPAPQQNIPQYFVIGKAPKVEPPPQSKGGKSKKPSPGKPKPRQQQPPGEL